MKRICVTIWSGVLQAEFKEVYVAADGEEAWELLDNISRIL